MDVDALEERLAMDGPGGVFSLDMLAGLPAPAVRYLRHAIAEGTPLAGSVELEMRGRFRPSPRAPWVPLAARELLAPPIGFVWRARLGRGAMRISGHDLYADGHGEVAFKLWRLWPVAQQDGPDVDRSAAGRLGLEAIWMPSALLPVCGARWEPIDDAKARVHLRVDGRDVALVVVVDGSGALVRVVGERWNASAEPPTLEAFGTEGLGVEQTFGGFTIPTKVIAGWRPGASDAFMFLDVDILQAMFR